MNRHKVTSTRLVDFGSSFGFTALPANRFKYLPFHRLYPQLDRNIHEYILYRKTNVLCFYKMPRNDSVENSNGRGPIHCCQIAYIHTICAIKAICRFPRGLADFSTNLAAIWVVTDAGKVKIMREPAQDLWAHQNSRKGHWCNRLLRTAYHLLGWYYSGWWVM